MTVFVVLVLGLIMTNLHLILVFCTAVLTGGTQVDKCSDSNAPLPTYFEIVGCEKPSCKVRLGEFVVVNMNFTAPHHVSVMRAKALAKTHFLYFPVSQYLNLGDMERACDFLTNTECPLDPGQEVVYSVNIFIQDSIPKNQKFTVEFSVEDDENHPLICVSVPVIIV